MKTHITWILNSNCSISVTWKTTFLVKFFLHFWLQNSNNDVCLNMVGHMTRVENIWIQILNIIIRYTSTYYCMSKKVDKVGRYWSQRCFSAPWYWWKVYHSSCAHFFVNLIIFDVLIWQERYPSSICLWISLLHHTIPMQAVVFLFCWIATGWGWWLEFSCPRPLKMHFHL